MPPSRSTNAATGSMTNAAVNNVILSRMVFRSSRCRHFARRVPDWASRIRARNPATCIESQESMPRGW
jgi:hypothetical protein